MPKGPCRTCLALEPMGESKVGVCHADPLPMKIKDYPIWWCNRYEADPALIKAEQDAEKTQALELKRLAKAEKDAEKANADAVNAAVDKMSSTLIQGDKDE